MARIKNNITSAPSGKIGNMIASSCYGIPYLRSKPAKVNQPNTEKQLAQRMRMNNVLEFVKPLREFLPIGFGAYAIGKSAYNVAMSVNMKNALTGNYPDINLDYEKALVSMGNLPGALNPEVSLAEAGLLKITWDDNSDEYTASGNDKAVLLIYNPKRKYSIFNKNAANRDTGEASIYIPENFQFEDLKCYVSFARQEYLNGKVDERGISESRLCKVN